MCGIAGYIGKETISDTAIDLCLEKMGHRGPDARGVFTTQIGSGQNVLLLHTRLKIIDLDSRADQPYRMNSLVMVYNGELYNYLELKNRLQSEGCRFSTQSDTEVLLAVCRQWGLEGLDQCEGMWSFALFGTRTNELVLCRDRFGEKPLYYYETSSGIYFGSEVKFIHALLGRKLAVNKDHVFRYIINGYKSIHKTEETFFQGLHRVPAGHFIRINESLDTERNRYWLPEYNRCEDMTYDDAVEGVRERLIQSMEIRLRADVPLAFCMSGGIDSNSLISIAKKMFDYDVHGFTIVNTDHRYEEQDMVQASVEYLGIKHTPVGLSTRNFLDNLEHLICHHDSPVSTISYYVHWLLMKEIAQSGYKISISGTGADELLTGYYDHHNLYLYEMRDTPEYETCLANWEQKVGPIVRNPYLRRPDLYIQDETVRDHIYLNNDVFADYLHDSWYEPFTEKVYSDSMLRNRMLNELFEEAVPVILHEDDLNAMYFSIENRSPFLDRNLFDFCLSIPDHHLIREGLAKAVLRDAMTGIVSEEILRNSRKVGFNAPILSLLDVHEPATRSRLLDSSPIYEYFDRSKIETLLQNDNLSNSESKFLFYFLNSKIFLEQFAA